MIALAVDLGGSHATCAIVRDKEILSLRTIATENRKTLGSLLPKLSLTFREVLAETNISVKEVSGCAFAFCGLVDSVSNRVLATNEKYVDAPELDLVAWGREQFGVQLKLENDARMALLGERHAGAAHGFDDIAMVTLGTGIGGVAMIGGKLLRGKHFQAGCLGGHLPITIMGRKCSCGNLGCVEAEASSWSLSGICKEWPGFHTSSLKDESEINFEILINHITTGDSVARQIMDHCSTVWATATVALIHAYDPEMVVFGGSVMKSSDLILPGIHKYVDRYAWTPWGKVRIEKALLGNNAALLGAVPLLQENGR
jgi:glucokinase